MNHALWSGRVNRMRESVQLMNTRIVIIFLEINFCSCSEFTLGSLPEKSLALPIPKQAYLGTNGTQKQARGFFQLSRLLQKIARTMRARRSGWWLTTSQMRARTATQMRMSSDRCVLDCDTMKVSTRLE